MSLFRNKNWDMQTNGKPHASPEKQRERARSWTWEELL